MAGSLKFDTWLNDDDTENYKCRAWVNFNGTGTVAIRASGNVSSITDNGTGDYTLNFTNIMSDANYCSTGSMLTAAGTNQTVVSILASSGGAAPTLKTASAIRIVTHTTSPFDPNHVNVAVFR